MLVYGKPMLLEILLVVYFGGPTTRQFYDSYNGKYGTNYSNDYQDLSNHRGYNDKLYFPHYDYWNDCAGYWLNSLVQLSDYPRMAILVFNYGVSCGDMSGRGSPFSSSIINCQNDVEWNSLEFEQLIRG